jgi:hypothetical protein
MRLAACNYRSLCCQPTPTEVFVVEKDTERMVEKANSDENGTVANSLGIPSVVIRMLRRMPAAE